MDTYPKCLLLSMMYNFLAPKLQFSAAGGISDLVTQKTIGGKKWREVNYASVFTNTVLGGRNLISSSLWESTGSFFILSKKERGLNFNEAGLKDFATGSVGNLVGNIWGKQFEGAGVIYPGRVSLGNYLRQELINVPGEFTGNLFSTILSR